MHAPTAAAGLDGPAIAMLSDEAADESVDRLKAEADRHYWINANRSLELAEQVVQIGQVRGNLRHTALGLMTRGDALKFLGRTEEAWAALGEAGALFHACGDEVGWARTRIGRLLICVDLSRVAEALADAGRARAIFARRGVREKQVVLDLNTGIVYNLLGDQRRALALYHDAIGTAEALGEAGRPYLGLLYNCTGVAYHMLGAVRDALFWYDRAYPAFLERQERSAAATVAGNIATIAMAQGDYRRALRMLHDAHRLNLEENLPLDATHARRAMVECYLQLNRHTDARALAQEVAEEYHRSGVAHREAITLLHLAAAEAQLGNYAAAQQALETAEARFRALDAPLLVALTQLGQGQIALRQHDVATAEQIAVAAGHVFESAGNRLDFARAQVLYGRSLLARGDMEGASCAGGVALRVARQASIPALRYTAHVLLGRAAEAQQRVVIAERHYRAAAATVARVEYGLTITMRPGFLEDKGEALRALIALYLRAGQGARAFNALEQAKSQALLSYLTNQRQLHWEVNDAHSRALIGRLNQLRDEHQWLYRDLHGQALFADEGAAAGERARAQAAVAARERQMRAITEELYLRSPDSGAARTITTPKLADVQQQIAHADLMLEFYSDGETLWAFAVDQHRLEIRPLRTPASAVTQMLHQLQLNFASALMGGGHEPLITGLTRTAQRILERLATALLAPLADLLAGRRRLVVVPYGVLHYLPFHLLRVGGAYLIEHHEVVILPAGGLITRRGPSRPRGARVLAHTWDGRLPHTLREGGMVAHLLGGVIHQEHDARRSHLDAEPSQVLHIAAHGEYRMDQPELSYLQLEDGQLYTDDLLQHDLSYELVTLSGCETGRATTAPGDELIGLGRGFLYAGAGAVIASLWHVPDAGAAALMERLYRRLLDGHAKATALREAQVAALQREPHLHPAIWGAFQLVGDPRPLTEG